MDKQKGAVPIAVIIVIALSSLLSGFLGFKLGDGVFFSLGIGIGAVFLSYLILKALYTKVEKDIKKKNRG